MSDNPEEIISVGTFVKNMAYFIKIGIFINTGTTDDNLLNRCIKLYNKFKTIEAADNMSDDDRIYVRRCLKRVNLTLKVDPDGKPINILDKENQTRIMFVDPHSSLAEDDYYEFHKYIKEHNLTILSSVPLTFIVRGKYSELLWQYVRAIFYISQYLLSKTRAIDDQSNPLVQRKIANADDALDKLADIFEKISTIEAKIKIHSLMAKDVFLNSVCVKTGINEEDVRSAQLQVLDLLRGEGLGQDPTVERMVGRISDHITGMDLENGNIIETVLGVAQSVAEELKKDVDTDPEKFQNTLFAITNAVKKAISTSDEEGDIIPPEIRDTFDKLINLAPVTVDGVTQVPDEAAILEVLDGIAADGGIDRDEFYNSIRGGEGGIDVDKLENILKTMAEAKITKAEAGEL